MRSVSNGKTITTEITHYSYHVAFFFTGRNKELLSNQALNHQWNGNRTKQMPFIWSEVFFLFQYVSKRDIMPRRRGGRYLFLNPLSTNSWSPITRLLSCAKNPLPHPTSLSRIHTGRHTHTLTHTNIHPYIHRSQKTQEWGCMCLQIFTNMYKD